MNMAEPIDEAIIKELNRLPERKERGSPHNLIRAIAAGFILDGNSVEQAVVKALDVIGFWDSRFHTDSFKDK
jgi:hypothetical protein